MNHLFCRRKQISVLRLHGPDAPDFLHRLTTANVKRLGLKRATRTLVLTGSSQIVASFRLYRESETSFLLVAETEEFPALREHLARMHFSENLEQTEVPSTGWWLFHEELDAPAADSLPVAFDPESPNLLVWGLAANGLAEAVRFGDEAEAREPWDRKDDPTFWERLRIQARIPRFRREWTQESRALDVGFLLWIDRNKGCYPGQEVVEKSLNVGHPARALVRLEFAGEAPPVPVELQRDGKPAGQLTSAVATPAGGLGLAVVKWDARNEGTTLTVTGRDSPFIVSREEA